MMPEYIRVTDLSKVYRKHEAVKHISFHVGKGQIFAFLGPVSYTHLTLPTN